MKMCDTATESFIDNEVIPLLMGQSVWDGCKLPHHGMLLNNGVPHMQGDRHANHEQAENRSSLRAEITIENNENIAEGSVINNLELLQEKTTFFERPVVLSSSKAQMGTFEDTASP